MEKEQPFDPFEFAEEDVDKNFRKGFVMDTGMEAANPFTPAQPRIEQVAKRVNIPIEIIPPIKKVTRKEKIKTAIRKKMEKMS